MYWPSGNRCIGFQQRFTTSAIVLKQLVVILTLILQPESGGPAPISCAARLLEGLVHLLLCAVVAHSPQILQFVHGGHAGARSHPCLSLSATRKSQPRMTKDDFQTRG